MSMSDERAFTHARLLHDWMVAHADAEGVVVGSLLQMADAVGLTHGKVWHAMQSLREGGLTKLLSTGNGRIKARWRLLEAKQPAGWGEYVRYTDERVERARKLWDEGVPSGTIAREMGMSKNQIIGMAHRNGFAGRPSPITGEVKERKPAAPRIRKYEPRPMPRHEVVAPPPEAPETPEAPPPPSPVVRAPVVLTPARGCQFPLWPTGAAPTHEYCNKPTPVGSSWCPECRRRVFNRVGWAAA